MDNTEIHYLTYDPEKIFQEMNLAYIQAGGDILYPGDEKEMLLRGVQAMIVQVFAGVDAALRMDTLRYAVGDYLDIYGEKRNCVRLAASSARGRVKITFKADGITRTIAAGTALTADGERIYLLDEDVEKTGYEQEVEAGITCKETGAIGNGLAEGNAGCSLSRRRRGCVHCDDRGSDRRTGPGKRRRIPRENPHLRTGQHDDRPAESV